MEDKIKEIIKPVFQFPSNKKNELQMHHQLIKLTNFRFCVNYKPFQLSENKDTATKILFKDYQDISNFINIEIDLAAKLENFETCIILQKYQNDLDRFRQPMHFELNIFFFNIKTLYNDDFEGFKVFVTSNCYQFLEKIKKQNDRIRYISSF